MKIKLIGCFILLSVFTFKLMAAVEINEFSNKQDEQQFKTLINELRCVVCQNQNLADSNAELAKDLRKEIYQMIHKGFSSEEISDFMVARYGDFVLYKPPFNAQTWVLWLGPFVVLLLALMFLLVFIKNKKSSADISDNDKRHAEKLIQNISNEKE